MRLVTKQLAIPGVLLLEHEVFDDARGFFMEVYRRDHFRELGLPETFVQLNQSRSKKNVIRGLHFQWEPPMGKLMRVSRGAAFLVAVDIRRGSPTLGQWVGEVVTEENRLQMWAPAGFARGFCVLSDLADVQYLCTAGYNPACEGAIRWNDPEIAISWPVANGILSPKDAAAGTLSDWLAKTESRRFTFGDGAPE